jgi:hypothetical protein
MEADDTNISRNAIPLEKIVDVCRTNVEALHNLHFLMTAHIKDPEHLTVDLGVMNVHLQAMTDELCRKV